MDVFEFKPKDLNPVPSLQDQAKQAMNIQTPELSTQQPPAQEEDPMNIDYLMRGDKYLNAVDAILANAKPVFDPEKEKRYKARAAFNSIGEGFKTIFDGISHTKGMNVLPNQSTSTAQANDAYSKFIDDKKAKLDEYSRMITNSKISGLGYREQLQNTADQMKYNIWKTNLDNATKRDAELFDRKYKLASLEQDQKQFLAELVQKGLISEATLKQRKNESDQEHLDRLAAIAAQRENNFMDYEAEMNKNKESKPITFINPGTGQPDEIDPDAITALVQLKKTELEKGKKNYQLVEMAQTPGSDYNLISRYLTGGLTAGEKEYLARKLYNRNTSLSNKIFSRNDIEAYKRGVDPYSSQPIGSNPKSSSTQQSSGGWTRVDANGNPIK